MISNSVISQCVMKIKIYNTNSKNNYLNMMWFYNLFKWMKFIMFEHCFNNFLWNRYSTSRRLNQILNRVKRMKTRRIRCWDLSGVTYFYESWIPKQVKMALLTITLSTYVAKDMPSLCPYAQLCPLYFLLLRFTHAWRNTEIQNSPSHSKELLLAPLVK